MLFPHPNQRTLPVRDQSIPYSDAVKLLSRVRLFATPWTIAYQAPPFMGFSKQEYCSGLPFPSPGVFPHPGIKPLSLVSPALAGDSSPLAPPGIYGFAKSKSKDFYITLFNSLYLQLIFKPLYPNWPLALCFDGNI